MPRPRERDDVEPHLISRVVPFNQEAFFTPFDVAGQRAVRKAEPRNGIPNFVDGVDDAGCIDPPEAAGPGDDEYRLTGLERRVARKCFEPAKLELLPAT